MYDYVAKACNLKLDEFRASYRTFCNRIDRAGARHRRHLALLVTQKHSERYRKHGHVSLRG